MTGQGRSAAGRVAGRVLAGWLIVLGLVGAGLVGACLVGAGAARAALAPDEMLADAGLEARAQALDRTLRCVVCLNESIHDSPAPLARDLRRLVRERLAAGDGDAAIRAFLVSRYGDFVLLDPPLKPATYLLWFGPALILAGGAGYLWRRRARAPAPVRPLSDAERTRLQDLLS